MKRQFEEVGSPSANQQTITERKKEIQTEFFQLLVQLIRDPHAVVGRIKEIHRELGAQAKAEWVEEREDFEDKGSTPFLILLCALEFHPESSELFGLVQEVNQSFCNDQAKTAWSREIEHDWNKGATPFYYLLSALSKNPKSEEMLVMVQTVHNSLGDEAKTIWAREIECGRADKGATPFYWLLDALYKNYESQELLDLFHIVHHSLRDQAKVVWATTIKEGWRKGTTPFYKLLQVLVRNPELVQLIRTVHDSLSADQAKIIWAKEEKVDYVGATPFYWLLCVLDQNPESRCVLNLVQEVHKILKENAKMIWTKVVKGVRNEGATPFYWSQPCPTYPTTPCCF